MYRIGRNLLEQALKGRLTRVRSPHLTLSATSFEDITAPLCAVIVSKKVSKLAVERNRIKRRCREAFRCAVTDAHPHISIWYPKKEVLTMDFGALCTEMEYLLGQVAQKTRTG